MCANELPDTRRSFSVRNPLAAGRACQRCRGSLRLPCETWYRPVPALDPTSNLRDATSKAPCPAGSTCPSNAARPRWSGSEPVQSQHVTTVFIVQPRNDHQYVWVDLNFFVSIISFCTPLYRKVSMLFCCQIWQRFYRKYLNLNRIKVWLLLIYQLSIKLISD